MGHDPIRIDERVVVGVILEEELDHGWVESRPFRNVIALQVGTGGDASHHHLQRDHVAAADDHLVRGGGIDEMGRNAGGAKEPENIARGPATEGTFSRQAIAASAVSSRDVVLVNDDRQRRVHRIGVDDFGLPFGQTLSTRYLAFAAHLHLRPHAASPSKRTARSPPRGTISPTTTASGTVLIASPARSAGTIPTRPIPMLNTRYISSGRTDPSLAIRRKMAGGAHVVVSISALRSGGSMRATFSGNPPPVTWANPRAPMPMSLWISARYERCGASNASPTVMFRVGSKSPHVADGSARRARL